MARDKELTTRRAFLSRVFSRPKEEAPPPERLRGHAAAPPAPAEVPPHGHGRRKHPSPLAAAGRRLPILRPPGAVEEQAFLASCTRCHDCVRACPTGAIVPGGPRHHSASGVPVLDPSAGGCRMCADLPCVTACGPQVLTPLIPLRMGTAHVIMDRCVVSQGTDCTLCITSCPVPGALQVSAAGIQVAEALCTGCGSCRSVCPAPENAVVIVPVRHRPPFPDPRSKPPP